MAQKPPMSVRLSEECRVLIGEIAVKLGLKTASVLELAVRRLAEQERVALPPTKPKKPSA